MKQNLNQLDQPIQLINHGKLPNSSYYDIVARNSLPDNITSPNEPNSNQHQPNNTNLEIWSCAFSPCGEYLAWSCGYGIIKIKKWKTTSSKFENKVKIGEPLVAHKYSYELSKSNHINTKKNENNINLNSIEPNMCSSASNDIAEIDCGEVVWSLAFGSSISYVKHNRSIHKPKLLSKVNTRLNLDKVRLILAVGLSSGKIKIYDMSDLKFLFVIFDHKDLVRDLKFTKDGSLLLASVSRDETIKLWNMYDDGNMYKTLKGHTGYVYACDWSPSSSLLCSVGSNRQAFIWNTETYTISQTLRGHLHDVVTCEFSPDGMLLATGSYDTKVFLWDPYTGVLIRQFLHLIPVPSLIYAGGHNGAYVRALKFSPDGNHLLTVCDDKKLRIWSLCNKSPNPIAEGTHKDGISCAFSLDPRKIIIGTRNGHLEVYEAPLIIERLVNICRKSVNEFIDRKDIERLLIPAELEKFLLYENIRDRAGSKK